MILIDDGICPIFSFIILHIFVIFLVQCLNSLTENSLTPYAGLVDHGPRHYNLSFPTAYKESITFI